MGIVRETYQSCMKVKQILRTQLVRFEERDVFMSADYQAEIRDRMRCGDILVPQVFVDGQHIGVSVSLIYKARKHTAGTFHNFQNSAHIFLTAPRLMVYYFRRCLR